jgi:selenocysteine lyase/cysteine desulfurase
MPHDDAVAGWRADTPGAERSTHLNNAGAALMPQRVHHAVAQYLERELVGGGYEVSDAAAPAAERAYGAVARLFGVAPRNVAVVESSTTAFAQALAAFDFAPGDVILTTRADYASNQIMFLSLARRRGVRLVRAEDLPEGGVDPESVRALIRRERPALVSVTWIPTNSGLVQPVEAVGAVCDEAGVPYLVDACQAVGQLPVNVPALRCDFLAATARKFLRGPRGIGMLIVSDRALDRGAHPLLVDMHGATWTDPDRFTLADGATRFELWERSWALLMGLGEAAVYAEEVGAERARDRAWALAAFARERLAGVRGVRVLDRGRSLGAIVTCEVAGRDGAALKLALRERGIHTSSPGRSDAVIDMDAKGARSALRLSPHYYNTVAEIERAVSAIESLSAPR